MKTHGTFTIFCWHKERVSGCLRAGWLLCRCLRISLGNLTCDYWVKNGAFHILIDFCQMSSPKTAQVPSPPPTCEIFLSVSKTWYCILFVFWKFWGKWQSFVFPFPTTCESSLFSYGNKTWIFILCSVFFWYIFKSYFIFCSLILYTCPGILLSLAFLCHET